MEAESVVIKRLVGGAAAYNLILGFIPKKVTVVVMSATNPDLYEWYGELQEDSAEGAADSNAGGDKNTRKSSSPTDGANNKRITAPAAGAAENAEKKNRVSAQ